MPHYAIIAGIALIMLGFIVVLAGLMLNAFTGNQNTKSDVRGGGVVFIGPIPIVFGSDHPSVMLVSILAVVMMITFYLIFRR